MNTISKRAGAISLLLIAALSALFIHPDSLFAQSSCSPSPIACPSGKSMYYMPAGDTCPNGGYVCGARPVAPAPAPAPVPPTSTTPRTQAQTTPAANTSGTTLSIGSRGAAVTLVQQQLATLAFLNASGITGYFGTLTRDAVRAFQRAKNIASSGDEYTTGYGAVGPRTKLALTLAVREKQSGETPLPDRVVPPPTLATSSTPLASTTPEVTPTLTAADLASLTDIVTRTSGTPALRLDAAKRRAVLMERLATENPREFLRSALSSSARSRLPNDVQTNVEQQQTISGKLEVLHVDDFARPERSRFEYWLRSGKNRYKLGIPGKGPEVVSDTTVNVVGYAIGQAVVADSGNVQVVSAPPSGPEATGVQRTLVILMTATGRAATPTKEEVNNRVFTGAVQGYYAEESYGRVNFTGLTTDWITVPENKMGCAAPDLLDQPDIKNYLVSHSIAPSSYDRIMYVVNGLAGACAFVGKTDVPYDGATVRVSQGWVGWPNNGLEVAGGAMTGFEGGFAHEMGHGLGLVHAASWFCNGASYVSGCSESEYGNRFDIMGLGFYGGHFNAFFKDRLSWFTPAEKINITSSGHYTLAPLEAQNGVRVAIIQNPNHQMEPLYVEFRDRIGFDSGMSIQSVGLHINETFTPAAGGSGNNAAPRSRLLNGNQVNDPNSTQPALRAGGVFDYVHRAIKISGVEITGTGASFDVSINGVTPTAPAPTVQITVNDAEAIQAPEGQKTVVTLRSTGADAGCSLTRNTVVENDTISPNGSFDYTVHYNPSETEIVLRVDCYRERPPLVNGIATDSVVITKVESKQPPTCSVAFSPATVRKDQGLFISWSSEFASSRSYVLKDSAGRTAASAPSVAPTGGTSDESFRTLSPGTYTRTDTVVGDGGSATCTATLTVQSVPTPDQARAPIGTIDAADCSAIEGWAFDQDTPDQVISVHAYFDGPAGTGVGGAGADTTIARSDVNAAYSITGTHGFRVPIPESFKDGRPHTVYVHGIDSTGKAGNQLINGSGSKTIRCGDLDERRKPQGVLDAASCNTVEGWVYDPDTLGKSAEVHFYIDTPFGAGGGSAIANTSRPDVHAAYGVGTNHGFTWQVPQNLKDNRTHKVYAYGIDTTVADVNNVLLYGSPKSFNCSITGPIDEQNRKPQGFVDVIDCNTIVGWSFDQDTPASSNSVHVYADNWNFVTGGVTADPRPDVNAAYSISGVHGFAFPMPANFKDGREHTINVYGIDTTVNDVNNVLLAGSSKTIRCGAVAAAANPNLANALTALESLLRSFLSSLRQ